jgi:hypothetical protein
MKMQAVGRAEFALFTAYLLLVSCLTDFPTLKGEAVSFSETSVSVFGIILRYIPEESPLYSHRCENLKSSN